MYSEDLVIKKFFKNKSLGFYVDVGCYHPIDGNNTYLLFKKGWRGINIDINKLSIELFQKARKKDLNINTAVSNKSTKVKLYYRKKMNMLNTINEKLAKSSFKKGYRTTTVKSDSLNSILENSKYRNKKIDFLNLDIEGNELKALKSLNFKKYKPKLICVEIHNQRMSKDKDNYYIKNPIYKFLCSKGYRLMWKNGFSFILKR
tara:strand:- start:916 stop:1524 length:609 start_codon:yes stop_codon:yes gene_type:complete